MNLHVKSVVHGDCLGGGGGTQKMARVDGRDADTGKTLTDKSRLTHSLLVERWVGTLRRPGNDVSAASVPNEKNSATVTD